MRKIAIFFLRLYQLTMRPFIGDVCRFYPSCSNYSIQALEKYGLLKGCWLTCRRLLKCHPWHPGGHDPA